jgi:hypothetical protein
MHKKKPAGSGTKTNTEEPEKKSIVKFVVLTVWQCFKYAVSI